jgi:hypothetical protein
MKLSDAIAAHAAGQPVVLPRPTGADPQHVRAAPADANRALWRKVAAESNARRGMDAPAQAAGHGQPRESAADTWRRLAEASNARRGL